MEDNLQTHNQTPQGDASSDDIYKDVFISRKRKVMGTNQNMKKQKQNKYNSDIPTNNRFEPLSNVESDEENMDMDTKDDEDISPKTPTTKMKRPPPLVIHDDVKSHNAFIGVLKGNLKEKFHVKYHKDFTEVFTANQIDYEQLKSIWQQNNLQFHTYTDKNVKKRTYVIKGLHKDTDIQELKQELERMNYTILSVYQMKNTRQPLYMVTFTSNIQLKALQHKVPYLQYTKIEWNNYINKRRITQCHKCQVWGHATNNCYAAPACLKCAEGHLTQDCKKASTTPAKCINCGGDHPANATCCVAYKARLELIEMRATNKSQRTSPKDNAQPIPTISDRGEFPGLPKNKSTQDGVVENQPTTQRSVYNHRPATTSGQLPHQNNKLSYASNLTLVNSNLFNTIQNQKKRATNTTDNNVNNNSIFLLLTTLITTSAGRSGAVYVRIQLRFCRQTLTRQDLLWICRSSAGRSAADPAARLTHPIAPSEGRICCGSAVHLPADPALSDPAVHLLTDCRQGCYQGNEVKELNKIFDIKKMLVEVKKLKNQLLQCENEAHKFQVFLNFCDNLNDG